jgi:hypothetical protein
VNQQRPHGEYTASANLALDRLQRAGSAVYGLVRQYAETMRSR